VNDLSLDNALSQLRDPQDILPREQLAQNFEGAFEATWVLSSDQFHELVFNSGGGGSGLPDSYDAGQLQSAEWYLGVDHLNGTAERAIKGVVPTNWSVDYSQGEEVSVTFTAVYGDEELGTEITPGSIVRETDTVPGHGASLSINGVTQGKLQSATLSVELGDPLIRGPSRQPVAAVPRGVEATLETEAVFDGVAETELAYGSAGATSPEDLVGGTEAVLSFERDGTLVAEYGLSVTPADYAWEDLVNPDEDIVESVTFNGTDLVATS
jgi:hypothetical protein